MAKFLLNNVFRFAFSTLNFVSPTIIADVLLHPFDFATVLLQIGYAPDGCKYESASLVSIILQYALFTFYIPYLLTSMQGFQFMGMAHPGILHYVNYIYSKEGVMGCYRGLLAKICERLTMIFVNEKVKRTLNKDSDVTNEVESGMGPEVFLQNLMRGLCSHFFAVIASHPFHVLVVSSFAEFTCGKNSSILDLSYSIFKKHGCSGFFTGLIARLLGELLSQIFSVTYTTIINKQVRPQQTVVEIPISHSSKKTVDLVNYVTDVSRFTAFKPKSVGTNKLKYPAEEDFQRNVCKVPRRLYEYYVFLLHLLENITQNSTPERARIRRRNIRRRNFPLLAYAPLTSRLFYYIMIRDFVSKKISNPFLIVCHCAIVLDTGWDKFPLLTYMQTLFDFKRSQLNPSGESVQTPFYCVNFFSESRISEIFQKTDIEDKLFHQKQGF